MNDEAVPEDPRILRDAAVVGGGPAGLAAATWLARYRRTVTVFDTGEQRNRWTDASHGYLTRDHAAPDDLRSAAAADLLAYPTAEIRDARVEGVDRAADGTLVVTADDTRMPVRRLVLATGVVDAFPEVDGFFTHYGASVFHCPSCDGYETRGADVVTFGWNPNLAAFAASLMNWARSVTLVAEPALLAQQTVAVDWLRDAGVRVAPGSAAALLGDRGDLRAVQLEDGTQLPCGAAFFCIAHGPRTDLAQALGCDLDDEGYVRVDHEQRTSVDDVYAAGDVTAGMQLVQIAASKGVIAGVTAALSLQGEPPAPGAPTPAPDVDAAVAASDASDN